jgi:hypothetical protein
MKDPEILAAKAKKIAGFMDSPVGRDFEQLLVAKLTMWFAKMQDQRSKNEYHLARCSGAILAIKEILDGIHETVAMGRIFQEMAKQRASGMEKSRRESMMASKPRANFDRSAG